MRPLIIILILVLAGCAQNPPVAHQPSSRWVETNEPFRSYTTYQYLNYPGRIVDGAAETTAREFSRQLNNRILEKMRR